MAWVLVLAAGLLVACADEPKAGSAATPPAEDHSIPLSSLLGCRIDSDCGGGTFCFQRACVHECASDAECGIGAVCSPRARCVVADAEAPVEPDAPVADEDGAGAAETHLASIEVVAWPPITNEVRAGQPFIQVPFRTKDPVPGGVLLYYVRERGEDAPPKAMQAHGTTDFQLTLPTFQAGGDDPDTAVVQLTTPMGSRNLYLVPAPPRAGQYAGAFTPPVFGGAGLPLEFSIETIPDGVTSLADADQVYVWLPTSSTALISLLPTGATGTFLRRPLEFDESLGIWVATFSEDVSTSGYFGPDVFTYANRGLRLEIFEEDGSWLRGAIADRWRGLFEKRTADGVPDAGMATVAGYFEVGRFEALPASTGVRDLGNVPPTPRVQAPPALDSCTPSTFAAAAGGGCAGIIDRASFEEASASSRASCALELSSKALGGQTIRSLLHALLDPDQPNPGGMSFREFIEACASETNPLCQPSEELLCSRDLVAHAYRDADASGPTMAHLATAYDETTREAFIGRQLAAFQVDTESRLKWLRSSEAPLFLAGALRDYNEEILRAWKADVLDAHLDGIFGQLDSAGLAVLGRSSTDPVAIAKRKDLLMEVANSWRAGMDALVLLTSRWNVLHQGDSQRARSAAEVRTTAFRLYASAAIIQELSREVGATYLVAEFGAGFSALMRELNRLSLPFDQLIFARDAEVVAARSLDPSVDSRSLLKEMEATAREALAAATESIDLVLDEAQANDVNEATLASRYEDQLLSLRNELIQLCGLPEGCTPADVGSDPLCQIPTQVGRCGFAMRRGEEQVALPLGQGDKGAVSDAGIALLALQASILGAQEAEERLQAHAQVTTLEAATTTAFAEKVQEWDRKRRSVAREVDGLLEDIAQLRNDTLNQSLETVRTEQAIRQRAYEVQKAAVEEWNTIRVDGVNEDMTKLGTIMGLEIGSAAMSYAGARIDLFAKIVKQGMPEVAGPTTDAAAPARMGIRTVAFIASSIMGSTAFVLDSVAKSVENDLARQKALREANFAHMSDLAELKAMATENQIASVEAHLRTLQLRNDREEAAITALIDALRRNLAMDQAHERDLMELRDRRDALRIQMIDALGLSYQAGQADLTARQKELAYFEVVQKAQLIEGRFRNMQVRWQSLDSLLGSADVLFSFANRMARAESRLDHARRSLEDWLVALEYYAVRPFVSQRMAILLARNPTQLEAIANEFLRLQLVCGGPTTLQTLDVSVRDGMLGMGFEAGAGAEQGVSPGERFRALLRRAETPAQGRIAFSPVETIGQRLDRGGIWALDFDVSIDGFANLARSCNAKLDSIAVQLVGDDLGAGQPVVSVVHHGSSRLRSCQPGIREYVSQFGPGATAFAPITSFETAGRTISPVAGIGSFGEGRTWNKTLEGVPFSAGYSLLIDLEHPSNQAIRWDRLEDVRLQFRYTYQDVFPTGQCE